MSNETPYVNIKNTVDIESQITQPYNSTILYSITMGEQPTIVNGEQHAHNSIQPIKNEGYAIFSCILCLLIVILFPFIFCDLYYSFNSISCQNDSTPIGFTLATWLQVCGFYTIGSIIFITLCAVLSLKYECMIIILTIVQYTSSLFSFAWLIVGCVMFWRYLEPSGNCNSDISNYMWARLIIGIVCVFATLQTNKKEK